MRLLSKFSRSFFPGALLAFGASWVLLGFLYDRAFVGTSFPADAPIELQIQYDRNRLFLNRLHLIGVSIFALGLVASIAQVIVRTLSGRAGRRPGPLPPS